MDESSRQNQYAKRCSVFAHRGANREAMENTRHAFDKALDYAIDGIETDVQMSRDEVAVLWHDRYLDKIGLPGKRIDDFDFHELQKLINPDSASEGIMMLQDFVMSYRNRCHLLIEVKNRDWEAIARHQLKIRRTLDLIGDNPQLRIVISSFNLTSLDYAHQYNAIFPLIFNFETHQTLADARQLLHSHPYLYGLCLPIETADHAIVDLLHSHHKCVAVYTCNTDLEINKALRLGVDILISDLPQRALMLRDQ